MDGGGHSEQLEIEAFDDHGGFEQVTPRWRKRLSQLILLTYFVLINLANPLLTIIFRYFPSLF